MKTTLQQLFDIAIQTGVKNDVRGEKKVKEYLADMQKDYKNLKKEEKQYFDLDHLENPYPDSKIYHGDKNKTVKKVIVGIDVEGPEILLVNEYNKNNKQNPIDLVIAHHPEAKALLDLDKVMKAILPENDFCFGVPINQAEKLNEPRAGKVGRSLMPINYNRSLSFAKLLDIPFLGFHTPADNMCFQYIDNLMKKSEKKIKNLADIIEILESIPEMQISKKMGVGPQIWAGDKKSKPGKIIAAGITGGTSGSEDIYAEYAKAGVGTVLMMHISEDHLKKAKENNLNIIITDHMASDSLGMNLILDEFEKLGVEILEFSGFIRVSRVK